MLPGKRSKNARRGERQVAFFLNLWMASSALRGNRRLSRAQLSRAAEALRRCISQLRAEADEDSIDQTGSIEAARSKLADAAGGYNFTSDSIMDEFDVQRMASAEQVRLSTSELEGLLSRRPSQPDVLRATYLTLLSALNRPQIVEVSIKATRQRVYGRKGGRAAAKNVADRELLQYWADEFWPRAPLLSKRKVAERIINERIRPSLTAEDVALKTQLDDPAFFKHFVEVIQRALIKPARQ